MPPQKAYTINSNVARLQTVKPLVEVAFEKALDGKIWEALTLNGLIYSSASNLNSTIAIDALAAGALAAGLCGKGPAVSAVVPNDKVDEVKIALQAYEGEIIVAHLNHDESQGALVMVDVIVKKTIQLRGKVEAPPSKSYTQRMIIAAALSKGKSIVSNPLYSEDTEASLRAVTALGARFESGDGCWQITGAERPIAAKETIDCGESGATLRFMIPVAALADGPSILTFRGSIERRPVEPLLESLRDLGANAKVGKLGERDAVFVEGGGLVGGKTTIPGDVSSQFISGLMFACPLASAETEITLTSPLESADYVKMTEAVLSNHAVVVGLQGNRIIIKGNQTYKPADAMCSRRLLLSSVPISCSSNHQIKRYYWQP